MKRWIFVVLTVLLVAAAVYWWVALRGSGSAVRYLTAKVQRGDVASTVTATGTLEAVTQVDVGSELSGRIQAIYVKYNEKVKRGQLLAQLDPSQLEARVEQAQASVNSAQSQYSNAVAGAANALANVRAAEAAQVSAEAKVQQAEAAAANAKASLIGAEANVRRARADRDVALKNYERQRELRQKDLIAQNELDTAQAQYLAAQASLEGAEASLQGAQASHRSAVTNIQAVRADTQAAFIRIDASREQAVAAQAQVEGARAQVTNARATLESARVDLGRTSIRSPIDGVVLDVKVSEGQTVAAQMQAPSLFILARNLENMQVETSVDEADVGNVRQGANATFTVDAYPDKTFKGRITEVRQSPVVTQNVVTYPVIIQTQNPDLTLKPGMTATVTIDVETRKDVLMAPSAALRFRPTAERTAGAGSPSPAASASPGAGRRSRKPTVYTVDASGELVKHEVEAGLSDGIHTELVKSDLQEGQEVVIGTAGATSGGSSTGGGGRRGPRML